MLGTQLSSAKPLHDSQRQQGPDWLVQVDHTKCRNSHFLIRAKGRSHAAWRCPCRRDAAMINLYMVFTDDQVIGKRRLQDTRITSPQECASKIGTVGGQTTTNRHMPRTGKSHPRLVLPSHCRINPSTGNRCTQLLGSTRPSIRPSWHLRPALSLQAMSRAMPGLARGSHLQHSDLEGPA